MFTSRRSLSNHVQNIVVLLSITLLWGCATNPSGGADAKEQIGTATRAWADAMSRHDMEGVLALYDSQAVLWGTRSPTIRETPEKVRQYFNILRTVPPSYKAVLVEQHIRVYGDMAINSGRYNFSEVRDGKEIVRPSRFSFVYRNRDGRWLIVDHHSSAVPAAAK